jgi:hypothetical protein
MAFTNIFNGDNSIQEPLYSGAEKYICPLSGKLKSD